MKNTFIAATLEKFIVAFLTARRFFSGICMSTTFIPSDQQHCTGGSLLPPFFYINHLTDFRADTYHSYASMHIAWIPERLVDCLIVGI